MPSSPGPTRVGIRTAPTTPVGIDPVSSADLMPTSPGPSRIGARTTPTSQIGVDHRAPAIAYDRALWFTGEGPPPTPSDIGAKVGDMYLDTLTYDVFELEA